MNSSHSAFSSQIFFYFDSNLVIFWYIYMFIMENRVFDFLIFFFLLLLLLLFI